MATRRTHQRRLKKLVRYLEEEVKPEDFDLMDANKCVLAVVDKIFTHKQLSPYVWRRNFILGSNCSGAVKYWYELTGWCNDPTLNTPKASAKYLMEEVYPHL